MKLKDYFKKGAAWLAYLPIIKLQLAYKILPVKVFKFFLNAFTDLLYILKVRSKVLDINLQIAFPDQTEAQRKQIKRKTYRHLGSMLQVLIELKTQNKDFFKQKLSLHNWPQFLEHQRQGPLMIVSGHFGVWELMCLLPSMGIPFSCFADNIHNPFYQEWLESTRKKYGLGLIYNSSQIGLILKSLINEGTSIGFAADFSYTRTATKSLFFNKASNFIMDPYRLAVLFKMPLFYCNSWAENNKYHIKLEPLITTYKDINLTTKAQKEQLTQQLLNNFLTKLESSIKARPEQYFWLHKKWKNPQEPHLDPYKNYLQAEAK